jgi:hypothetical protein
MEIKIFGISKSECIKFIILTNKSFLINLNGQLLSFTLTKNKTKIMNFTILVKSLLKKKSFLFFLNPMTKSNFSLQAHNFLKSRISN